MSGGLLLSRQTKGKASQEVPASSVVSPLAVSAFKQNLELKKLLGVGGTGFLRIPAERKYWR